MKNARLLLNGKRRILGAFKGGIFPIKNVYTEDQKNASYMS